MRSLPAVACARARSRWRPPRRRGRAAASRAHAPGQAQPQDAQARAAAAKAEQARVAAEAAWFRSARAAIAHGKRTDAESMARARGAGDPAAAAILGRLAIDRGQYDDALARPAARGRTQPARRGGARARPAAARPRPRATTPRATLVPLVNAARGGVTADGLLRAARAAHALDQTRTANSLYRDASVALKNDPAVNTAWGRLFHEKHTPGEAVKSFRIALAGRRRTGRRPTPAWPVRSPTTTRRRPPPPRRAPSRSTRRSSTRTSSSPRPRSTTTRPAAAKASIDRVLAINPRSPEAHTLLAAIAWVAGRTAEYEAEVARALAVNPTRGDTYRVVAAHAARNYRFDEAVALGRKAIALEPANIPAHAELGMHLLRTGDEREARRMLETAFRGDPYDVVTLNLLRVLDTLDGFESQKSDVATIRMDPDEAPVLRLYAGPLAAKALAEMRVRYGLEMKGPVVDPDLPEARRLRRPHDGPDGHGRRARRQLRLGRHAGLAARAAAGRVQLAGDHVARAGARVHAAAVEPARAAVGHRGHLGLRGGARGPVVVARLGAGVRAGCTAQGKVLKLADLNSGFARPDTDFARLLRVVARGRR